jgi:hypothetical protein
VIRQISAIVALSRADSTTFDWKKNAKQGTLAGAGLNFDSAIVAVDDALRNRQA